VKIQNPQKTIGVTGSVKVTNQADVEKQIKNIALAIRELQKPLKNLKEVKVNNFPVAERFPKFPAFPTSFKVDNQPTEMKMSNVKEILIALQKLENSISELKLNPEIKVAAPVINVPKAEAPVVNVKAPIINVEKPDLSDITKIIEFLTKLTSTNPLPVRLSDGKKFYNALQHMADIYAGSSFSAFQDATGVEARAMVDRNNNLLTTVNDTWGLNHSEEIADTTYLGKQSVSGEYRIIKIVDINGFQTLTYASIRNNQNTITYNDAWQNRGSLQYGFIMDAY